MPDSNEINLSICLLCAFVCHRFVILAAHDIFIGFSTKICSHFDLQSTSTMYLQYSLLTMHCIHTIHYTVFNCEMWVLIESLGILQILIYYILARYNNNKNEKKEKKNDLNCWFYANWFMSSFTWWINVNNVQCACARLRLSRKTEFSVFLFVIFGSMDLWIVATIMIWYFLL